MGLSFVFILVFDVFSTHWMKCFIMVSISVLYSLESMMWFMGFIYYKWNKECSRVMQSFLSIKTLIKMNIVLVMLTALSAWYHKPFSHRGGCSSGGGAAHLLLYCLYCAKSQQSPRSTLYFKVKSNIKCQIYTVCKTGLKLVAHILGWRYFFCSGFVCFWVQC